MATAKATVDRLSFLDLPTAAKIIAAGPMAIGKNKKEIAPKTIAMVEKVLEPFAFELGTKLGAGVAPMRAPQLEQLLAFSLLAVPQFAQKEAI
jgi:hypothetical protein